MSAADAAIEAARSQIGVPYSWGGGSVNGPTRGINQGAGTIGFDCSSLVQYAYHAAGINLPRTSQEQQRVTQKVTTPTPGDLVFYGSPAHHVGIYLGKGQMLAAPSTGDKVKVQSVYSAKDGPTYGHVPYAGTAADQSWLSGAGDALKDAGGKALDALTPDWAGSAEKLAVKGLFVALGVGLVGVGVVKATGATKLVTGGA